MKWVSHGLAWLLLIALIVFAPTAPKMLPNTSEGLASENYAQWAGVLRLWVSTGWQPGGGFIPWFNQAVARFERRNPGVYVQVESASDEKLKAFASEGANPPDMIVFSPSMLASPERLLPLGAHSQILNALQNVGMWRGVKYAEPVAMGGYAWAINTRYLSGAPLGEITLPPPAKKGTPLFLIQAPGDGAYVSWSGALLSLCLHTPQAELSPDARAPVGDGIDLGLATPIPAPEAVPEATSRAASQILSLPAILPENFRAQSSALSDFLNGRAAAIPVTQFEIRKLEQRSEQGRCPDWAVIPGEAAYTDQLALFAITNFAREDVAARQQFSAQLLELLLDDTSQKALSSARALRTTTGAQLYTGQSPMAALERGYLGGFISAPNAFDARFRSLAQARLGAALRGH